MGLGILFMARGGFRQGNMASVNLVPSMPAFGRCVRRVRSQKMAYVCQLNQSSGGTHPIAVISLFTMNWSLR